MRADVIDTDQFPALMIGQTLADVERGLILETLRHVLGNRTHAANILGISIRTLRNKLNEYANAGAAVPPPRNWSVGSHQDNRTLHTRQSDAAPQLTRV
jgi:Bacterial regulatory protein, Fis family